MADNLFLGLPPPSERPLQPPPRSETDQPTKSTTLKEITPAPILKSALKRSKSSEPQTEVEPAGSKKQLTFKTTVDASEKQVIEAIKASKLAIQLIQAGSINAVTSDHFIAILEAAMFSTTDCTNPSLRADYHTLLSAAQDVIDVFATKDEDVEEAEALVDEKEIKDVGSQDQQNMLPTQQLLLRRQKKSPRDFKSQREALILCLEIAVHRYKLPWCQTVIGILVKHAFENKERFTSRQRDAIEKLWTSIREQQNRQKQGKSVTGKLDMNASESLQEKYANKKISIRRAVGGNGSCRAQQWLG
ncbi:hypothetical protein MKX01_013920 [Papaver californicum]|nr:hypothetical protein MKX01_013920 [Papaver californicum]